MAVVSGIHRTIIIPFGTSEGGGFDEPGMLTALASLVASTSNVMVSSAGVGYRMFESFSAGAWHFGRGIAIELWTTVAGDAIVLGNMPTFQAAVGGTVYTWSHSISFGF